MEIHVRKGWLVLVAAGAIVLAVLASRECSSRREGSTTAASAQDERGPSATRMPNDPSLKARPGPLTSSGQQGAGRAPGAASTGNLVIFSAWGSDKNQLGRERPVEGNPEGPMSFTLDPEGRVLVLDQVNGRVVRYGVDGKPESTVPIKLGVPQDIAIGKGGSMAVLDRLSSKVVAIYDEGGALRCQIPLEGEGVPEGGLVTGLFIDKDDVYVEREHGPLVRIGDVEGRPADVRSEMPGRPSRDGLSFLKAGISDPGAGRVYVASTDRATNAHRFTRELRAGMPVHAIVLLDTDRKGTIYLAITVEPAPETEAVLLYCLEPSKGAPVGKAELPANTLPEETFRDMVVLDEGGVLYSLRSESGVSYERYTCQ